MPAQLLCFLCSSFVVCECFLVHFFLYKIWIVLAYHHLVSVFYLSLVVLAIYGSLLFIS